ncbi:hypothetical protein ACFQU9_33355 [Actinomadura namibiensis]|uniref:hypothetical protein n=1 Tax=Actinomadura kijaniata TaxID=46161 RepID=UPI003607F4D8
MLANETLPRGAVRQYDQPRLNVVVYDPSACDVWVKGEQQPPGKPGQRKSYTITKKS